MHINQFDRFTDRARRVIIRAQEEARTLNGSHIGTEHILLGLIHDGDGLAAKVLESWGVSLEGVRTQIQEITGYGSGVPSGHVPFTPRAKKVLQLSLLEAVQLDHDYIGTEHVLLGLIYEGRGVGAQALNRLGVDLNRMRQQVVQFLAQTQSDPPMDPRSVFSRYTDDARRVIVRAQEEARALNHGHVGTEHILLGLIREGEVVEPMHRFAAEIRSGLDLPPVGARGSVAAKALETSGISLQGLRAQVQETVDHGQQAPPGYIPFTSQAKKALELSLHEAVSLDHSYIGTEHLLLGLVGEGDGMAAQVLNGLGADLNQLRRQVVQLLAADPPYTAQAEGIARLAAAIASLEDDLAEATAAGDQHRAAAVWTVLEDRRTWLARAERVAQDSPGRPPT